MNQMSAGSAYLGVAVTYTGQTSGSEKMVHHRSPLSAEQVRSAEAEQVSAMESFIGANDSELDSDRDPGTLTIRGADLAALPPDRLQQEDAQALLEHIHDPGFIQPDSPGEMQIQFQGTTEQGFWGQQTGSLLPPMTFFSPDTVETVLVMERPTYTRISFMHLDRQGGESYAEDIAIPRVVEGQGSVEEQEQAGLLMAQLGL